MLTEELEIGRGRRDRNRLWERRLQYDPSSSGHLGCPQCSDYSICGGLRDGTPDLDCFARCCGKPDGCDRVCPRNSRFPGHVREIGGLSLGTVSTVPAVQHAPLPLHAAIIYHSSARQQDLASSWVGLPLYRLFDRRTGRIRYADRASLCSAFNIDIRAKIILTGVADDRPLEAFWSLSREGRQPILQWLVRERIEMVTAPNFSLFTDRPRWDDMHAMKRILICASEMMEAGVPTALHPNGRTDRDFERWAHTLARHPEFDTLSYEFGTGAGHLLRRPQHVSWLNELAKSIDRPLHLIVRGGRATVPEFVSTFAGVTYLDSDPFCRAMKRKRLVAHGGCLRVLNAPTVQGSPVDRLLADNISAARSSLVSLAWASAAA